MSMNYLTEAFKELKLLDEGRTFNFDEDGAAKMANFLEDDVLDDYETIIDPEATTEEELQPTYVGNVILGCETCHSMIYKAPEDVVVDEETQLANVGELCPYCFTTDGFKLVGKVAPFEEVTVETDADVKVEVDGAEVDSTEDSEELTEAKITISRAEMAKLDKEVEDARKEVAKYNIPLTRNSAGEEEPDFSVVPEDQRDDAIKAHDRYMKALKARPDRAKNIIVYSDDLKEAMEDISITTGDEVIKIKSTPRADKEEIAPLSDTEVEEITEEPQETEEVAEPTADDIEIEEIDEVGFDELGESYLKRVYENVESFKTVAGKRSGAKIILEGVIKFNSGKKAKTSFVFESREFTKRGKLRLFGENVNIASNKGAFILTGRNEGKKLICEAFTYNYNAKDAKDGSSKKLYGTVRK